MLQSLIFFANERLLRAARGHVPVKLGETGDAIRCLQVVLTSLGYDLPVSTKHGTILADGIFGQETYDAVVEFQEDNNLAADGVVGPQTLARMDQVLASGNSDPLRSAVRDLRAGAREFIQSRIDGDAFQERRIFEAGLYAVDRLVFGDPRHFALKVQRLRNYLF
jgi:peptidoglycan hydrolase-like protein with peptidoglycan-binding domain